MVKAAKEVAVGTENGPMIASKGAAVDTENGQMIAAKGMVINRETGADQADIEMIMKFLEDE